LSGVGRGEFEKEGKTIRELVKLYEGWIKTFRRGAENMDNRAYEKARVERPKFEEEKWIPLSKVAEAKRSIESNCQLETVYISRNSDGSPFYADTWVVRVEDLEALFGAIKPDMEAWQRKLDGGGDK